MRTKTIIIMLCLLSLATAGYGATFTVKVLNGTEGEALAGYPVMVRALEKTEGLSQQVCHHQPQFQGPHGQPGKRGLPLQPGSYG